LPIKVRIVGEEYKDKDLTGRDICGQRGIEIYYNKRDHDFSTTELRTRIADIQRQKSYTITASPGSTVKWSEP
jgi:glycerol-3-phosphate cytidylyltransferase